MIDFDDETFGVEIEMSCITREKACKVVSKYFGSSASYEGGYYEIWTTTDSKGRTWKFMYDGSLIGDNTCEMVTPVLKYDDIDILQNVIRELRKAGAKSYASYNCGVHIHIGVQGHSAQSIARLICNFASHEDLLSEAINISPNRRRYCEATNANFLTNLIKRKPSNITILKNIWYEAQPDRSHTRFDHYHNSRYHTLNLHSLMKNTIEFRLFQFDEPSNGKKNGLHAGQVKAWVQLCLAMSVFAKKSKRTSYKKAQMDNPAFAMRTWLNRMGMTGNEFATARKVFNSKLSGNTAHRRIICA